MPKSAANAPQLSRSRSSTVEGSDLLRELLARGDLDPNYPTVNGVTLLHELCHKEVEAPELDESHACKAAKPRPKRRATVTRRNANVPTDKLGRKKERMGLL